MKNLSKFTLFIVLVLIVGCSNNQKKQKNRQPNIIFIMSDDHAYQAISAYNGNLNNTPNIDRIAKEGAIFQNSFVTNSICAPSRAVMLTGKHSFVNGKINNFTKFDWNQDNIAKQLQKNGYETALVGKIHIPGVPQGFDYSAILPGQGQYYNPDFIINGKKQRINGYCTNITTSLALNWLKNMRNKEKPFLLLYHQKAPHRTWMPEKKYFELYEDSVYKLPDNFWDNYQGRIAASKHKMGIVNDLDIVYDLKMLDKEGEFKTNYRAWAQDMYNRMDSAQKADWDKYYTPLINDFKSKKLTGEELAKWKFNRYMHDYLRTIQSVDDGVGEVLNYLDKSGLADNTIVVYTSDQGFYLGEHGWFDKRWMYEESMKTPLLIRYPKEIKANTIVDELVQNLDYAATFLDYAGIEKPKDVQGESFRNIVSGKSSDWRDAVYYTYYEHPSEHNVQRHYGIRTKRYKLIHFYYDDDNWELYDLEKDPKEMNNVYDNPEYAEIKADMHKKLEDIRKKYGDSDELNKKFLPQKK